MRDAATQRVHECVRYIKELPKERLGYMTLKEYMDARAAEAVQEIREQVRREVREAVKQGKEWEEAFQEVWDKLERELDESYRESHKAVLEARESWVKRVLEKVETEDREESRHEILVENIIRMLIYLEGEMPESVCEVIQAEKSEEKLKMWLKLAAPVASVKEFEEQM